VAPGSLICGIQVAVLLALRRLLPCCLDSDAADEYLAGAWLILYHCGVSQREGWAACSSGLTLALAAAMALLSPWLVPM